MSNNLQVMTDTGESILYELLTDICVEDSETIISEGTTVEIIDYDGDYCLVVVVGSERGLEGAAGWVEDSDLSEKEL